MGGSCLSRRDWRRVNMVLVGESDRFFRIAKKVVWEEPEPWIWKPKYTDDSKRRVGRPPEFMVRPLVMLCLGGHTQASPTGGWRVTSSGTRSSGTR